VRVDKQDSRTESTAVPEPEVRAALKRILESAEFAKAKRVGESEGRHDPVRIEVPKGRYNPTFKWHGEVAQPPQAPKPQFVPGSPTPAFKNPRYLIGGLVYALRGSLERDGGQIRVNVQLIDITNNATIWADRFDGKVTKTGLRNGLETRVTFRGQWTSSISTAYPRTGTEIAITHDLPADAPCGKNGRFQQTPASGGQP